MNFFTEPIWKLKVGNEPLLKKEQQQKENLPHFHVQLYPASCYLCKIYCSAERESENDDLFCEL
jgi:regulator of replication initiation timing